MLAIFAHLIAGFTPVIGSDRHIPNDEKLCRNHWQQVFVIITLLPGDGSVTDDLVFLAGEIPAVYGEQLSQYPGPIDITEAVLKLDRDVAHRAAEATALAPRGVGSRVLIRIGMTAARSECDAEYHSAA